MFSLVSGPSIVVDIVISMGKKSIFKKHWDAYDNINKAIDDKLCKGYVRGGGGGGYPLVLNK